MCKEIVSDIQINFLYTTCPPHVLQKEELLTKIYLYRSILVTPSDVSWKFTCYDEPNKDILVSDMALLEGQVPVVTGMIIYRTRAIITRS